MASRPTHAIMISLRDRIGGRLEQSHAFTQTSSKSNWPTLARLVEVAVVELVLILNFSQKLLCLKTKIR